MTARSIADRSEGEGRGGYGPGFRFGLLFLILLLAASILVPWLSPWGVDAGVLAEADAAPSLQHWLGTDPLGRDVFTRLLAGARTSLFIAGAAVVLSGALGLLIGVPAGYLGGGWESAVARTVDGVLAFPALVLLLVLSAFAERSIVWVVAILAFAQWPVLTRLMLTEARALRRRPFVEAGRVLGIPTGRILWRHLLPNLMPTFLVAATLAVGEAIVLEAGLSYLGLGLPEGIPSWGRMVATGQNRLGTEWWLATFPGLAIVAVVMAVNAVAEGIRLRLDPDGRP